MKDEKILKGTNDYVKILKENPNINPIPIVKMLMNQIKDLENETLKLHSQIYDLQEQLDTPIETKIIDRESIKIDRESIKIDDCTHTVNCYLKNSLTIHYDLPCIILEEMLVKKLKLWVLGSRRVCSDFTSGKVVIVERLTRVKKITEEEKTLFKKKKFQKDDMRDVYFTSDEKWMKRQSKKELLEMS